LFTQEKNHGVAWTSSRRVQTACAGAGRREERFCPKGPLASGRGDAAMPLGDMRVIGLEKKCGMPPLGEEKMGEHKSFTLERWLHRIGGRLVLWRSRDPKKDEQPNCD